MQKLDALLDVAGADTEIACRRDVVAHHEAFGKLLAAFQAGAFLRRADDRHRFQRLVVSEIVVDAFNQRVFVAHDNHCHTVVDGKFAYGFEVERRQCHIFTILFGSAVAGGDEEFRKAWALVEFPCQSRLATSGAKQQNGFFFVFSHDSVYVL